jgi:hypothetical protein
MLADMSIMSGALERHEFDVSDPHEFPDVNAPDISSCHIARADTISNAMKGGIYAENNFCLERSTIFYLRL